MSTTVLEWRSIGRRVQISSWRAPEDRLAIPVSSKGAMGAPLLHRQECPQPLCPYVACPRADWTYVKQLHDAVLVHYVLFAVVGG